MDAGTAALLGATIGASFTILNVFISSWFQRRHEHEKWVREKKSEAYSNTLRYLIKLRYKRSSITAEGTTYISKEHWKEWMNDLVLMIESLSSLSIFATEEFENRISDYASKVREANDKILYERDFNSFRSLDKPLNDLEVEIRNSAKEDLQVELSNPKPGLSNLIRKN